MRGDFHIHTCYSDGTCSIDDIIQKVKRAGLDYFAITDHDTLEGTFAAKAVLNNKDNGIRLITGIELSSYLRNEPIHVLGYFPDDICLDFFEQFTKRQTEARRKRALEITKRLKEFFCIDLDIEKLLMTNSSLSRGNIAEEILSQGYNYTKNDIFSKMIGIGCPAYIPSTKVHPRQVIDLIHDNMGLAILAHPVLLKSVDIDEIRNLGIDGIEGIYPKNKKNDTIKFHNYCKKNNLILTAGSDFHMENDLSHGNIGSFYIENEYLKKFLNKLKVKI